VGKNVYYTINHLCHMVLALKPFGCMPSSQSDGVQSAVINRHKDMVFLPIENLRRRRSERAQPRANGARRSQGKSGKRNSRRASRRRASASTRSKATLPIIPSCGILSITFRIVRESPVPRRSSLCTSATGWTEKRGQRLNRGNPSCKTN